MAWAKAKPASMNRNQSFANDTSAALLRYSATAQWVSLRQYDGVVVISLPQ